MKVIVTGSTRGIGRAISRELCRRGHYYYSFSRWNGIDVSDYECIKKAFEELTQVESPPEALINNAGMVEMGSVVELPPESWEQQFKVNMHGMFYCCKEYVKLLRVKKAPGKIINITSTSGLLTSRPGRSAYAASKAAAISFSLSLAEELRPYGIKVYCIAPGACATDLRRQIYPDDDFSKMMQPEQLARFIVDLLEGGEMLDGQVIQATGTGGGINENLRHSI